MDYFTVYSYTVEAKKEMIISEVKKLSIEEVPMITFTAFDGNEELLIWIDQTLS